jgi:DNA invertase Pin-like site-specific DNA recombinase
MEHAKPLLRRCAVYTRKSSEEGLEQNFNSLHAQREACEAFIKSQASEGWRLVKTHYDDGGVSGANLERPALQHLLGDIRQGLIEVVVVYKVDRLTRSLADFAKMVQLFDAHQVSFVAVTQSFNTATSMGRLTLNVLLSFAQFEREVTCSKRATLSKLPRRMARAVIRPNQRSTRLRHEALVGVKCRWKRGWAASHCLTAGYLWVPS